jgi:hypothetical protein
MRFSISSMMSLQLVQKRRLRTKAERICNDGAAINADPFVQVHRLLDAPTQTSSPPHVGPIGMRMPRHTT